LRAEFVGSSLKPCNRARFRRRTGTIARTPPRDAPDQAVFASRSAVQSPDRALAMRLLMRARLSS